MTAWVAGACVGIGADVGFSGDTTQRIVAEANVTGAVAGAGVGQSSGVLGKAIEGVVDEGFSSARQRIYLGSYIAQRVVAVALVHDTVADSCADTGLAHRVAGSKLWVVVTPLPNCSCVT